MKKLIINKCMELVTTYNKDLSQRDIDKIKYGLEGLYLTITKLIFIIIVSIILGIWKETLLLILIFNGIRLTAFGVHAKKSIDCLISSTLFFILFPILCIKCKSNSIYTTYCINWNICSCRYRKKTTYK